MAAADVIVKSETFLDNDTNCEDTSLLDNHSGYNIYDAEENDDEKMHELLREFDLEILYTILKIGDVTFRSLKYISENDINDAIRSIAYRAEFREKLFAWRRDKFGFNDVSILPPQSANDTQIHRSVAPTNFSNLNKNTTLVHDYTAQINKNQETSYTRSMAPTAVSEMPAAKIRKISASRSISSAAATTITPRSSPSHSISNPPFKENLTTNLPCESTTPALTFLPSTSDTTDQSMDYVTPYSLQPTTSAQAKALASTATDISGPTATTTMFPKLLQQMKPNDERELHFLLKQWNCEEIFTKLLENNVTVERFKYLSAEDIKELTPVIGLRAKFRQRLFSWRKENFNIDDQADLFPNNEVEPDCCSTVAGKFVAVDVLSKLKANEKGRAVLNYYKSNDFLLDSHRKDIISILIDYIKSKEIKLVKSDFQNINEQIAAAFPNENEDYYFIARGHSKYAGGRLYDKYHNTKTKRRKEEKTKNIVLAKVDDNDDFDKEYLSKIKDILKLDIAKSICVDGVSRPTEFWNKTYALRKWELKNSTNKLEFIKEWPAFKQEFGFVLFQYDFDFLYAGKKNCIFEKWDSFKNQILNCYIENIKDQKCKEEFACSRRISNPDAKNFIYLRVLNSVILPTARFKNNQGKSSGKYSIADAQECFTLHLTSLNNYREKIEESVTNSDYLEIATQIVQLFPEECIETYYVAPVKKANSKLNISEVAKGKLPDKFRNLRAVIRGAERLGIPTNFNNENIKHSEEYDTAKKSQTWLLHNREAPGIYHHWNISYILRSSDVEQKKYINVEDIFSVWPILKESKGHELIELDFVNKFPNCEELFMLKWNDFFPRLLTLYQKKLPDQDIIYKIILEDNMLPGNDTRLHEDTKTAIQFYLLASLMAPKANKVVLKSKDDDCKSTFWKPTIAESREGIILQVANSDDMHRVINEKKNRMLRIGLPLQPLVVTIGTGPTDIKKCYVCIDSITYELPSLLKAIDVLLKFYLVFNLPYPLECENFCYLIQWGLYSIRTKSDTQIPFVYNTLNMLKNQNT